MTQCDRVLAMLRAAGSVGVSSLEITLATSIVNVTGRVSDLRTMGHSIECFKVKKVNRYRLVQSGGARDVQTTRAALQYGSSTQVDPPTELFVIPFSYGVE